MKTGGLESYINSLLRFITLKTKNLAELFLVIAMAGTNSNRKGLLTFRFLTFQKSFIKKTHRGCAEVDKRATRVRQHRWRTACSTSSRFLNALRLLIPYWSLTAQSAGALLFFIFMFSGGKFVVFTKTICNLNTRQPYNFFFYKSSWRLLFQQLFVYPLL